jgi:hypothetical protein
VEGKYGCTRVNILRHPNRESIGKRMRRGWREKRRHPPHEKHSTPHFLKLPAHPLDKPLNSDDFPRD